MNIKKYMLMSGLAALLTAVVFWGCEGDPGPIGPQGNQGPAGPVDLNIQAILKVTGLDAKAIQQGSFAMSVYNAASIPRVTLNDSIILPDEGWFTEGGRLAYSRDLGMIDMTSATLHLSFTKRDGTSGSASSVIPLPNEFFAVENPVSIPVGNDVEAVWTRSQGAEAYWIYFRYVFDYNDTSGSALEKVFELDTVLAADDTTITIAGNRVYPDTANISTIDFDGGDFFVTPVTGPWLPGEANNIAGAAFGFFVGVGDIIDIGVNATPSVKTESSDKTSSDDIEMKALLDRRIINFLQSRNR